jgi:hypothetical protein
MELVAEYRRRADEVERRAESMIADENRRLMLELVDTWRTLADQRELRLKGEARTTR